MRKGRTARCTPASRAIRCRSGSTRIAELIGEPITPKLSCFRLNLAGELPHSWVHSDDICAEFASVLYLNLPEQCKGGTAFWAHDEWGDHLLSDEELKARGIDY
jgi:hypothetical protein